MVLHTHVMTDADGWLGGAQTAAVAPHPKKTELSVKSK